MNEPECSQQLDKANQNSNTNAHRDAGTGDLKIYATPSSTSIELFMQKQKQINTHREYNNRVKIFKITLYRIDFPKEDISKIREISNKHNSNYIKCKEEIRWKEQKMYKSTGDLVCYNSNSLFFDDDSDCTGKALYGKQDIICN